MTTKEIWLATQGDEHIEEVLKHVAYGLPSTKAVMQPYCSFRDEKAVIGGITIKGKIIIQPASLQHKALDQLFMNHMGIEKTRLSIWVHILGKLKCRHRKYYLNCPVCLDCQPAQSKDKTM